MEIAYPCFLSPDEEVLRMPTRQPHSSVGALSDEILMGQYMAGDSAAFDELFRRYEWRAFAFFVKRTQSPERAQDLYQELFLRIHRARDAYDASRPFAPWFFQIAHHLLIDDQRRAYRTQEVVLDDAFPSVPRETKSDHVADREQLLQLLSGLSETEQYTLIAAKLEGVGYAELAVEQGRSVAAVKKMVSRTLQRIRLNAHGAAVGLASS